MKKWLKSLSPIPLHSANRNTNHQNVHNGENNFPESHTVQFCLAFFLTNYDMLKVSLIFNCDKLKSKVSCMPCKQSFKLSQSSADCFKFLILATSIPLPLFNDLQVNSQLFLEFYIFKGSFSSLTARVGYYLDYDTGDSTIWKTAPSTVTKLENQHGKNYVESAIPIFTTYIQVNKPE